MKFLFAAATVFYCLTVRAVSKADYTYSGPEYSATQEYAVNTEITKTAINDTVAVNTLNRFADNYFNVNPDSTLYYSQKSIVLSRKVGYKAGLAYALLLSGHVNDFKGKAAEAEKDFNEAITIYKSLSDKHGLSVAYVLYGRMYSLHGNFKSALNILNEAALLSGQIKDKKIQTDAYKNIGIVYFNQGLLSKALDYYYRALFIAIENHYSILSAEIYNNIGVVLQNMQVYPNALSYFQRASEIFQQNNDVQAVAVINENIGEILNAQTRYDEAIKYLNKAILLAHMHGDKDGLSSIYTDLGISYAHKKQYQLSLSYLDTSLYIASRYNISYNRAYALIGFATVYNLQKDYVRAHSYAAKGMVYALELGNLSVRATAALELSKSASGLGDFKQAYQLLSEYNDLSKRLQNNESIAKLTSYNLALNFSQTERTLKQKQYEKDEIYRQRTHYQSIINITFTVIIIAMLITIWVYYHEKRKQLSINAMLEAKNNEVIQQKSNLNEQASKLNDLNKLKDRLISILAHDLRAPLSTLRGLFGLLTSDSITHDELLEMLPYVLKKLEYTSDFLDTLLFWINSQMDNYDVGVSDFILKESINLEIENYAEHAIQKGIHLIDEVPENLVAIADPNSVRIVVRNLVTNALKFSKENDSITISAHAEGAYITITVKDTGIGMSEEQQQRLFKTKMDSSIGTRNESGTGMGLLFCKDLVEKCNGKIWVTSQIGKGTEFSFTIPAMNTLHTLGDVGAAFQLQ